MKRICFSLLVFIISNNLYAKEIKNDIQTKKINFDKYLEVITEKLPELKKNKISLKRSKNKIYGAEAVDDPTLTAGTSYSETNQYLETENNGLKSNYNYSAGLEKTFSLTGTRLSTEFSYNRLNYSDSSTTSDYKSYQPVVTFEITQPILYNFLGKIDKYDYVNSKMAYEIDQVSNKYDEIDTLKYYKKLYFEWVQYREILNILKNSMKNADKLTKQVQRKVKISLADNDDYQRSYSSYLGYKANYEEFKIYLNNIEKELFLYLGDNDLVPDSSSLSGMFLELSSAEIKKVPFDKTLSGKIYSLTKNNLLYKIDVYNNKQLPELNLYANVSKQSISDEENVSASEMNDTDYAVGFEFKYTLGNKANKSDLNDIELQLKELNFEKKAADDEYKKNLIKIDQYILGYKNLISVGSSSLKSLKSQLSTEKKKYSQARLNLSYVIETENSIASKQIEIIQYKTAAIKYYIDYQDIIK